MALTNNDGIKLANISLLVLLLAVQLCSAAQAANIAYIYGDVSRFGDIPSGALAPYDQMLITDSGNNGLSQFKTLVESQGHTISQYYDATTNLTADFLASFDVVIFGLHQKVWSGAEKNALDAWLKAGGGMFIYSDSAAGGCFCESPPAGARNPVGQTATNNLIGQYGMQVTVDQGGGVQRFRAPVNPPNPLMAGRPYLKGEGVSPVAVGSNDTSIEVLIPYTNNVPFPQNVTINNRVYAALALKTLGDGHIAVMFDRQPMWNNGPGADINDDANKEILRRLMNFLAQSPTVVTPPVTPPTPNLNGFSIVGTIMLLLD